ncbi:Na/Pi symporter [Flammeovirgaceae bacterium SG7u.111]|nr:Na/Pi symporter [Flammeovirgaceae bacterium SG7u.132]WPO35494.1 Na/Pi symporter [Flammeovirgaceae bacterium SG7u.111]
MIRTIQKNKITEILKDVLSITGIAMLFLLSLEMMTLSFMALGNDIAGEIIYATSNPFVGLFIGLLSTAIIQSSSTTTTMVVAIVATGRLSLESAIPIIMGANVGTTVTCAIVSLGHFTRRLEFKKAIAAAALHNFFNIIIVAILFPLEYMTGFISSLSTTIGSWIGSTNVGHSENTISFLSFKFILQYLNPIIEKYPLLIMLFALTLLFVAIKQFTRKLQNMVIGKAQSRLEGLVFGGGFKSLGVGFLLTSIVQSSSVTTSLTVPLVAARKVGLKNAFPFIMGANVGTTVTALLAAISKSDAAISIAIAHFLLNFIGVLILFPIPTVRNLPIKLANKLGHATAQNRLVGFAYVLITFFLFPFFLIFFSNHSNILAKSANARKLEWIETKHRTEP